MATGEFEEMRSFLIDDGQLDGSSLQEAFVMGYELCMIDTAIEYGRAFSRTVHRNNRERIEILLKRYGRTAKWIATTIKDDPDQTWIFLKVAPLGE